ncbi:hypothetical protein [Streptomyces dysideae]|uniref:Uncharacterized protein n=1 Tax=Streptomyces dysideae TaxID=909626 RepID=A0A124IF04_9ACTN|nr:hypothetical protein [Streptomyces dysideae]KUO19937.1 hypothetical protein AQJ91_17505 [Streptomyces dysideae]
MPTADVCGKRQDAQGSAASSFLSGGLPEYAASSDGSPRSTGSGSVSSHSSGPPAGRGRGPGGSSGENATASRVRHADQPPYGCVEGTTSIGVGRVEAIRSGVQ